MFGEREKLFNIGRLQGLFDAVILIIILKIILMRRSGPCATYVGACVLQFRFCLVFLGVTAIVEAENSGLLSQIYWTSDPVMGSLFVFCAISLYCSMD